MGLGCGTTLVKYILFVFNFLIALGGIALVTIGAIALSSASDLKNAWQENDPSFAAVCLIVFGGIVFLISFFGCCGAIRESYCMTMTYASILFVIFVAQVAIAVFVLVNKTDFKDKIMQSFGRLWDSASQNKDTIQAIQRTFDCCGWGAPWSSVQSFAGAFQCAAENQILSADCKTKFGDWLDTNGQLLGWVAIGVAVVELVALIFACCLGNNVRNAERRYA